ncbi:MAG: tetratricopeptide repeat protein [Treponema sp.]|nr:tetratricopeptide repeat protein [Treponema sp.]
MKIKVFASVLIFALSSVFAQSQTALGFFESGLEKQNRDDFYGASEDFNQALQKNPAYGDAWFHLSQVTYAIGDFTLALTYLDSADKYAKNRTDIMNLRGLIYISLGKLDEAKKTFNEILKIYPNDLDARFGLAEIELYSGSYNGAKNLYLDALKRQTNNRKALLSLALLSSETGNDAAAENYISQALRYYSGDAEVHYLAAYLAAKKGSLQEAEKRIRASVQIKGDSTKAYVLLASILYAQLRYDDVIDVADYLISKNRKTIEAWYLKGLSQYRQNKFEAAISTWSTALSIDEQDEMMRASLELLVTKILPVEDSRRADWAKYHIKKAHDYNKVFMGEETRYEYQRALKLNPMDAGTRREFAEFLSRSGMNEIYLNQLKFIQNQVKAKGQSLDRKTSDIIENYDALMKYSLATKWHVDPFYLDKVRWHVGVFYTKSRAQLFHPDAEEIAAGMAADIFSGISSTSVVVDNQAVSGYGEAYRLARKNNLDYFLILSIEESDREISLDSVVYSGRTGTETARFGSYRTGNDRFASVLRTFRRDLLNILPIRGKIIDRSVNDILVDLGTADGIVEGAIMDVVKVGKITTADQGLGVVFDEKNLLGTVTITKTGEEISQGLLEQKGFYDKVNVGDEVLLKFLPKSEEDNQISDNVPAAGENGNRILPSNKDEKKISADDLGIIKTPAIIELIRGIK